MVATSIKLDDDLKGRVKHLAAARRRSPHWIMREAIAEYVSREEKSEAFRQGARKALEEYQATGMHATGDEVIAWLETWGTDDEKAPPQCHK